VKHFIFPALFSTTLAFFCFGQAGGGSQLKSIDEVIQGIDSLLDDLDRGDDPAPFNDSLLDSQSDINEAPIDRSFRVGNELMPEYLLNEKVFERLIGVRKRFKSNAHHRQLAASVWVSSRKRRPD